ncbi:pleckstrin homology domain-containing family B member 1 [Pristis pectinata]|uniref:pleckstrin homology domain-containing family B member 1 n=1 Tax=Pristis pectinata TaxID=685728 RepID=UPI00223E3442|nr:pleckstrin homology domain-containing family B member 1 [Pristis pectinata]
MAEGADHLMNCHQLSPSANILPMRGKVCPSHICPPCTQQPERCSSSSSLSHGSVLRRWKRNWFDLWLDGSLYYYQDENRNQLEDRIHLKINCLSVKVGYECTGGLPPEETSRECMLMIHLKDGSKLRLSADSADDALAWKLAFLEAKSNVVSVYDPADDHYQTIAPDAFNTIYISPRNCGYPCPGSRMTCVYHQDPYSNAGGQIVLGMLAGVVTGTMLRSLMWAPCWF